MLLTLVALYNLLKGVRPPAVLWRLTLYLGLNPVGEGRHPCVDARLALLPTAVSPGRDAVELEPARNAVLVDQWAS